jgi:hypothetical protein
MLVGQGVSSLEAGQVWHLLDTRVDLPVVKVDRDQVGRIRFDDYDVIILPRGATGSLKASGWRNCAAGCGAAGPSWPCGRRRRGRWGRGSPPG